MFGDAAAARAGYVPNAEGLTRMHPLISMLIILTTLAMVWGISS